MCPCWEAFWSTFAEKYALEKEVFFGSLARVTFQISGAFGMLWWDTLDANIDCSLEKATSQKPWFYQWISTVLTVAASPGSIQGEKNTHAEAIPVLGSRKNRSAQDLFDFREARGANCFL